MTKNPLINSGVQIGIILEEDRTTPIPILGYKKSIGGFFYKVMRRAQTNMRATTGRRRMQYTRTLLRDRGLNAETWRRRPYCYQSPWWKLEKCQKSGIQDGVRLPQQHRRDANFFSLTMFWQQSQYDSRLRFSSRVWDPNPNPNHKTNSNPNHNLNPNPKP